MITRARSRRQPAALPALPREVVQHIFSVKPPGPSQNVLSLQSRLQAQAVCKAWRSYLDPRQFPIQMIWLMSYESYRPLTKWVSSYQPAVRAIQVKDSCPGWEELLLFAMLSVAPRTVLENLYVTAWAVEAKSYALAAKLFPKLRTLGLEVRGGGGQLDIAQLGELPCLESLLLSGWEHASLTGSSLLPALKRLSFENGDFVEVTTVVLDAKLPSLQCLTVSGIDTLQLSGELPQLTQLELSAIDKPTFSWRTMPSLREASVEGMTGLSVGTAGLAQLTCLTHLRVWLDGYDFLGDFSGCDMANSLIAAAPPTLRKLHVTGEREDWSQPPPLSRFTQLTSLTSCCVGVIPHLVPLGGQLRKLRFPERSAADLTLDQIECLADLTSLQVLHFGGALRGSKGARRRIQVLKGVLPEGCLVEYPRPMNQGGLVEGDRVVLTPSGSAAGSAPTVVPACTRHIHTTAGQGWSAAAAGEAAWVLRLAVSLSSAESVHPKRYGRDTRAQPAIQLPAGAGAGIG